jgi:2-phosphosulfolactate phosphatase
VIDVLRATSVIATALANGAAAIHVAATPENARELAAGLPGALLGGERGARLIPGFDLANSPREYTHAVVAGRPVVMTTTNGTRAVHYARGAAALVTASFRNLPAVVAAVLGEAAAFARSGVAMELTILCAGTHDQVSIDDAGCAGMLLTQLAAAGVPVETNDFGHMCRLLYLAHQDNLQGLLRTSRHGQRLLDLDLGADLALCATVGDLDVVPRWDGTRLVAG